MAEMVIVIMVMGIVAAAATPAFLNSLLHHRVASAAHRLKTDLELCATNGPAHEQHAIDYLRQFELFNDDSCEGFR